MGGGNFALMFLGAEDLHARRRWRWCSQLGVPMTTLLSMLMLGERIRWRRGVGIALTFAGALAVMWDPHGLRDLDGPAVRGRPRPAVGSLGAVMMKQIEGVKPLQFQAWVGLRLGLAAGGAVGGRWSPAQVQSGHRRRLAVRRRRCCSRAWSSRWAAHTLYYGLIQRYEANLISPLTLMTPLATIALGVGDHPRPVRAADGDRQRPIALAGVLIIALRPQPGHAAAAAPSGTAPK